MKMKKEEEQLSTSACQLSYKAQGPDDVHQGSN